MVNIPTIGPTAKLVDEIDQCGYYAVIGFLTFDECLYFDARVKAANWLRITPEQGTYPHLGGGWMRADLLHPHDYEQLPVVKLPLPIPIETPVPTQTPQG